MRITVDDSIALIIDIQERLLPHIHDYDGLIAKTRLLIQGLQLLGVPLIITEQYPKGLGRTVGVVADLLQNYIHFEKTAFSCCDDEAIRSHLESTGRKTVLIAGIEAHVCILQTCIDLCLAGYRPFVVEDAVSSRKENDKKIALDRVKAEGGRLTTVESVLFELTGTSLHSSFREISKLVK